MVLYLKKTLKKEREIVQKNVQVKCQAFKNLYNSVIVLPRARHLNNQKLVYKLEMVMLDMACCHVVTTDETSFYPLLNGACLHWLAWYMLHKQKCCVMSKKKKDFLRKKSFINFIKFSTTLLTSAGIGQYLKV